MGAEQDRISALRAYRVLDTPAEPEFDAVVRELAASMNAPIALISFLDERRQWFKATVGMSMSETPLTSSFCTHAVRGDEVFQVPDAALDARFNSNPLVVGKPNIRFYAGAPLKTADGARVGTLCVIDPQPRSGLSDTQEEKLARLAQKVVSLLEARKRRRALAGTA